MDLRLEAASGVPYYRQIADGIADQIRGGHLRAGDALPSVRALARDLLVSVITTGRAYDLLEADGWIVRRQGTGTFVADAVAAAAAAQARSEAHDAVHAAVDRARRLGLADAQILDLVHAALRPEAADG